jgi:hypothetical protein
MARASQGTVEPIRQDSVTPPVVADHPAPQDPDPPPVLNASIAAWFKPEPLEEAEDEDSNSIVILELAVMVCSIVIRANFT